MNSRQEHILLLGLGNDLFGDDAIGLKAVRMLEPEFGGSVTILEASVSGFELMELLDGNAKALILDAIHTGNQPPGTIMELTLEDLLDFASSSPHYAGLSDVVRLANRLHLDFPKVIRILAIEIELQHQLKIGLSPEIEEALPHFLEKARTILRSWTTGSQPL